MPTATPATEWTITSMAVPEKSYTVRHDAGHWTCTCPHFTYRLAPREGTRCKHIARILAQEGESDDEEIDT
jgi:SWIM zinc finger